MCCFAAAHHNCGHLHQWFARCFKAKEQNTSKCTMNAFPSWQYSEQYPCPDCRAKRAEETKEVIRNQGHKVTKQLKLEDGDSTQNLPLAFPGYPAATQQAQSPNNNSAYNSTYHNHIQTQQPLTANLASNMPQPSQADLAAWVPPSRRTAQIQKSHQSSSPTLAPESTPTLSPEMLSIQLSPLADSEAQHAQPFYTSLPSKDTMGFDAGFGTLFQRENSE